MSQDMPRVVIGRDPHKRTATIEVMTLPALTTVDTPLAVSSQTPSGPVGLGATIHGWRPISVKIQPKAEARKGVKIATTESLANHGLSMILPLRVY